MFYYITPYRVSIDSYPFHSMSICPHIPGIQLFQNMMLKIQSQGHGWGQSWKSQHRSNIQSTHIRFVPCQSGIPFLSYDFFKIWPWKSRVKVTVQSQNVGVTSYGLTSLLFHVNQPSHSRPTAFSKFHLENPGWLGSRSNDHDAVQLQVWTRAALTPTYPRPPRSVYGTTWSYCETVILWNSLCVDLV